jgi:hypothetical protein
MITTTDQVYDLINRVIREARDAGSDDIAKGLDDAMCLGSSGLEILGAIKNTILAHRNAIEQFLAPSEIDEIVRFVNRTFGTE